MAKDKRGNILEPAGIFQPQIPDNFCIASKTCLTMKGNFLTLAWQFQSEIGMSDKWQVQYFETYHSLEFVRMTLNITVLNKVNGAWHFQNQIFFPSIFWYTTYDGFSFNLSVILYCKHVLCFANFLQLK